jgi:Fur family iron response transcriptional regulator
MDCPSRTFFGGCHPTRDAVAALFRAHGVAPTRQRVEIALAIYARGAHLSADQLLALVNERQAATSKATVYNTLNLLVGKGLLREVIVDPGRVFYDPNVAPHHHWYNRDTGEIRDIAESDLVLDGIPSLLPGTVVEGVDIVVRVRNA